MRSSCFILPVVTKSRTSHHNRLFQREYFGSIKVRFATIMLLMCYRRSGLVLVESWTQRQVHHSFRYASNCRRDSRSAGSSTCHGVLSSPVSAANRQRRPMCRYLSQQSTGTGDHSNLFHAVPIDKESGYSKLPRLYVGAMDSGMTRLRSINQLLELSSDGLDNISRRDEGVCHKDAILSLSPDQSRYLTSVLRLGKKRKGDSHQQRQQQRMIRVFDGSGPEWVAQIMEGSGANGRRPNKASSVTIQCLFKVGGSPSPQDDNTVNSGQQKQNVNSSVWLCAAPPKKKDRLRWMVEKTVELGVQGFFFVGTEFGEAPDKSTFSYSKLQAYAVEAAEQCERNDLPHFLTIETDNSRENIDAERVLMETKLNGGIERTDLSDFLDCLVSQKDSQVQLLVCRERSNSLPIWNALDECLGTFPGKKAVIILIGSEGGWSPSEEQMMDTLERECPALIRNISLGPNILRAETAAVTAVAAFSLYRSSN